MRRDGVVAMIGMLLLPLLAGCSPAVGGVGAVRLDDGQGLVGVFGLCKDFGELSTIILYMHKADGELGDAVIDLERAGPAPGERVVEVPLQAPPPHWHARKAAAELDPGQVYELRAWNKDGSTRVTSFPFRIGDLRDRAGTILTKTFIGSRDGVEKYDSTFTTFEGFDDVVTKQCASGS